jgi:hypothetical protein
MNPISQILWEAAADVERRGVTRFPLERSSETCAVNAIADAWRPASNNRGLLNHEARKLLIKAEAIPWNVISSALAVADWNDAQPSRAVVAAAMRDAAFLAEWAGPHLLGGSK